MSRSFFDRISVMRIDRDGAMSIVFVDGRVVSASSTREIFDRTSAITSSAYHPHSHQLHLQTKRGHNIVIELPEPAELAPLDDRPTIYLDQNHWSTLTNTIHEPHRVPSEQERAAAQHIITLATERRIVLPMSSAHMSETCKQVDVEQRYRRALTILRLSAGWQLRDPLALRRFELRQALTVRFHARCLIPPAAVTLEPNAIHDGRDKSLDEVASDLPAEARSAVHAIRCIGGIADTMLDDDHVPHDPVPGWTVGFQQFTDFLQDNPSGKELKRRRTRAKFMADSGNEIALAASMSGITTDDLSNWFFNDSEEDVSRMPSLGLFREVLHEKLAKNGLRWEHNDLTDMMYLTTAAGYCDHVVGERSHASHLTNSARRLGRTVRIHRNLQGLVDEF
ncbi:hypothetical protein [Amycolatopsis keratiniphila]|uniref:Uncharacterized protein n=1 Tax=Amycolatopsis keratiniphila subsp. keratiniphila TaxID=227715 RepID=A0A1W2M1I6_9PSEU|nr:hypothetical protein [Amycolatopsis keratiniphila]ONF73724.1 hypothetical protein AVR91_0206365 [Amycolatopsis keratiniphila subsp. keratiniphila]